MSAIQSASALTRALVHPSAQYPTSKRAAHQTFLTEKLLISAVALTTAPFFLVYRGTPTPADAAIFALALLQVAAAMIVARTGRLSLGHLVSFGSFLGLAAVLAAGAHVGIAATCPWLGLAAVEAASAFDRRLNTIATMLIGLALAAALAIHLAGGMTVDGAALAACVAVVAMLPIGYRAITIFELMQTRAERDRARGRAIAAALGDLVVGFDADGLVDQVSAECESMLGATHLDLAGRGLFEHVHVADRPMFLKLVGDAAHDDHSHMGELRLRCGNTASMPEARPQPRHVWVEMRTRRLQMADGRPAGVVAVLHDITSTRQQSVEVDEARRSVESAVRSKDEFLANMSHELRTPLNAIIGFSEMLGSQTMRPIEPDKQREYARIIHQSGQHLLAVVNSILDMSKIQSGTFTLIPEPFEVAPLVEQCCDIIHLKAQAGHVEIKCDIPAELDEVVGDRRACKQILINLLSNAVKFTPEHGLVTVRVRPEGTTLCLSVIDTGIGIGQDDLRHLGDPFFQARGSICRPYEGTGLGLSVVRGLVGLHGGTIAIQSEVGKGTNVSVRLPLDCRTATKIASATIDLDARRAGAVAGRAQDVKRSFEFPSPELRMKQSA